MKIHPVGNAFFHADRQTDRQRDRLLIFVIIIIRHELGLGRPVPAYFFRLTFSPAINRRQDGRPAIFSSRLESHT